MSILLKSYHIDDFTDHCAFIQMFLTAARIFPTACLCFHLCDDESQSHYTQAGWPAFYSPRWRQRLLLGSHHYCVATSDPDFSDKEGWENRETIIRRGLRLLKSRKTSHNGLLSQQIRLWNVTEPLQIWFNCNETYGTMPMQCDNMRHSFSLIYAI